LWRRVLPRNDLTDSLYRMPGRSYVHRFSRGVSGLVALLIVSVLLSGAPNTARASLLKPTYAAGDKWVYILDGSLAGFPGLNASQIGNARFGIVGLVTVEVVGPASVLAGNASVSAVQVNILGTGYLNGSFSIPGGGGSAQVTGSFTTRSSEYWENRSYLPIASNSTVVYQADVTYGVIPTSLSAELRAHATTSIVPIPRFDLEVGQNVTASLRSHLELNSTFTVFSRPTSMQNSTNISSTWRRAVLSTEAVTVEAGTFSAYRLNQTLLSFPGFPIFISGGNETAYFSNGVGFYAKRAVYANGTKVAEMRLKSYSYGAGPPSGLSATDLLIYVAIPVAVAILIFVALRRRRKARIQGRVSEAAPPESGRPQ
jgi:hypothetical protein